MAKKYSLKKGLIRISVFLAMLIVVFICGIAAEKIADSRHDKKDPDVIVMEETETPPEAAKASVSLDIINQKISNIGELAAVEYNYTDAGKFSDKMKFEHIDFLNGKDIPFTEKSFIVRWDGCIKAGIDVKGISCSIDEEKKTVTVTMPQAKILSHEIFSDSFETLDESGSLFNPVKVDDVNIFVGSSKEYMEKKAVEKGILEKADENSRVIVRNSLNSIAVLSENYRIVFEEASADE